MTLSRGQIISILLWAVLIAYSIFALRHCAVKSSGTTCTDIEAIVTDSSERRFITPEIIKNILKTKNIKTIGKDIEDINTLDIEKVLLSDPYIRKAKVYTSMDGKLHIEVSQRVPFLRIQSDNGYSLYLTKNGYVLPVRNHFFADVPIITGAPPLPFAKDFSGSLEQIYKDGNISSKNLTFVSDLTDFVDFLYSDSFWNAQIVQINALRNGDLELIPRAGDAVILLGNLDGYEQKLDKLLKFYRKGLAYEGWSGYKYIDIRFNGQVVCRKA